MRTQTFGSFGVFITKHITKESGTTDAAIAIGALLLLFLLCCCCCFTKIMFQTVWTCIVLINPSGPWDVAWVERGEGRGEEELRWTCPG